MANRRPVNAALGRGPAKLPPIPRNYLSGQSIMSQECGKGNSPTHCPRLPRIECCPLVQSKNPSSFRESEENNFPCLTIDEKSLRPFYKIVKKSVERSYHRMERMKELKITDDASMRSGFPTWKDHASFSSKKEVTKIIPHPQKALQRQMHLVRRLLKPERFYRNNNGQMSYEELLAFDENIDQILAFSESEAKRVEIKDFNGETIDTTANNMEDRDITSYIDIFEKQSTKKSFQEELPLRKETNLRVQKRFFEALDIHFYHCYRSTGPQRRMAICEEIERHIVDDGVALTSFREHLTLQDTMSSWVV